MALSKNFTLPEKCKNHWRALRESNIDQTVFYSKLFGSSLISQRNWRGLLLARALFYIGARSKMARQFLWWTFKFTLNEEEKKKKKNWHKEEETKKMQENILNGNHFATGCCFFFSKKNICFSIKISVFFVFHMNAALYLFHIDSFSVPPLPCRLTPSLKTLPENRSKWGHMQKKKEKHKKKEKNN